MSEIGELEGNYIFSFQKILPKQLFKVVLPFYASINMVWAFQLLHILEAFGMAIISHYKKKLISKDVKLCIINVLI